MSFVGLPGEGLPVGLIERIRREFRLDWHGIHGAAHWARVMHHGLRIAQVTGADEQVVRLFAVVHDSQRHDEGRDPGHGARSADFALALHADGLLGLDDTRADWLAQACLGHSDGHLKANPTIETCWDADRLDLGRVGIRPDPRRLCTAVAGHPEMIEFAWSWSRLTARRPATRPGRGE